MADKFKPLKMPSTRAEALGYAEERDEWAKQARAKDMWGSVKEFEFAAGVLRKLAERLQ